MEIIIMGLISVCCIVWYSLRHLGHKIMIERLEKENRRLGVAIGSITAAKFKMAHSYHDQLIQAQYDRDIAQKENKQLRADITCFRAELGLPPRKENKVFY